MAINPVTGGRSPSPSRSRSRGPESPPPPRSRSRAMSSRSRSPVRGSPGRGSPGRYRRGGGSRSRSRTPRSPLSSRSYSRSRSRSKPRASDGGGPRDIDHEGNLYVGNLAVGTTGDVLHDFFSRFGKIDSVKIIRDFATGRSKGFGFVKFESKRDADVAMDEARGKILDGRALAVNLSARNRGYNNGPDRRGGGMRPGRGFHPDFRGPDGPPMRPRDGSRDMRSPRDRSPMRFGDRRNFDGPRDRPRDGPRDGPPPRVPHDGPPRDRFDGPDRHVRPADRYDGGAPLVRQFDPADRYDGGGSMPYDERYDGPADRQYNRSPPRSPRENVYDDRRPGGDGWRSPSPHGHGAMGDRPPARGGRPRSPMALDDRPPRGHDRDAAMPLRTQAQETRRRDVEFEEMEKRVSALTAQLERTQRDAELSSSRTRAYEAKLKEIVTRSKARGVMLAELASALRAVDKAEETLTSAKAEVQRLLTAASDMMKQEDRAFSAKSTPVDNTSGTAVPPGIVAAGMDPTADAAAGAPKLAGLNNDAPTPPAEVVRSDLSAASGGASPHRINRKSFKIDL